MIKNVMPFSNPSELLMLNSIFEQGGLGQRTEWTSLP